MRRTLKFLAVASAVVMPAAAHAQACTAGQLAANPLVALGFRAFARIDNSAFDLSCYYQAVGTTVSLNTTSVVVGAGVAELKATVNQAVFDFTDPTAPQFNYGVASNQATNATTPADFVFAFASPLLSGYYIQADAQVGVTRASGNPSVSIVTAGSPSTLALGGGVPNYVVAQSNFIQVAGGGTNANPGATNLGVDVGGTACTSGTACSYAPATSAPNASLSAWLTVVSYRQARPLSATRAANAQVNGQVSLVSAVPEPATVTLMATGLVALVGMGYRRRNNA